MKRLSRVCLLFVLAAFAPASALAAGPLQRYTLVVGANFGGADRARLQFAVSDAERFARVMVDLGGVPSANEIVLKQPKLRDLLEGLELLSARVTEARRTAGANGGRTEVLFYYSGHADEKGLLLGEDRYSYRSLRDRLDQIPADVRIAVLDACASGGFIRLKGGRVRPPFLVDESAAMRGHAFLTSSGKSEAAQESDRIRASYFTHFLVSGFRGAADLSGDGKITLNEAYQFAFTETLGRTVDTRAGAQHPSYEINLSGTGDVVMTDVRQTTATLVLGEDLDGRFFIRTPAQQLVVELYKPLGRRVELGLEPGAYEVRLEREKAALLAKVRVADEARVVLDAKQFGATALEPTRQRGGVEPPRLAVAGRNRLEMRWGMSRVSQTAQVAQGEVRSGADTRNQIGGMQYTRYLREDLALTFGVNAFATELGSSVSSAAVIDGDAGVVALAVGTRWNPLRGDQRLQSMKPFIAAGLGPVYATENWSFVGTGLGAGRVGTGTRKQATLGGHVGGGADFHVARSFSIGVSGGYNWMTDFAEPVGSRDNFSGPEFGLSVGWLFGKAR